MESSNPDHFFQTECDPYSSFSFQATPLIYQRSATQAQRERRALKSSNKHGNPLAMKSKILAAVADPQAPASGIFIAESAGPVRRLALDVRCSYL
jgi:hypothetical protein